MTGPVHEYRTRLTWEGSTGIGYDGYDRSHRVSAVTAAGPVDSAGSGGLQLSCDPAFLGDATQLNREQLLVAAASSCHFLSFVAIAARRRLDVVTYVDEATGVMPEADRPMRITSITLNPHITLRVVDEADLPRADDVAALHDKAHHQCFIANSLSSKITVVPTFTVAG